MVNSSGVPRALFSATYRNEKSWLISAHSITPAAASAAPSTTNTQRRPTRRSSASCICNPANDALIPTMHAPAPSAITPYPSAAFTRS